MYWWNYRKLAEALRNNAVSTRDMKAYWAVFLLAFFSPLLMDIFLPAVPEDRLGVIADYLNIACCIAIPIMTYIINKSGDGKDYIKRLVSLSFPNFVRSTVIFGPLILMAVFLTIVLRTLQDCRGSADEAALNSCVASNLESMKFGYPDLTIIVIALLVSLYWYRDAFLYVSGKKPL